MRTFCIITFLSIQILAAQSDIVIKLSGSAAPRFAVPDFRASGRAQAHAAILNSTLWEDLDDSGELTLVLKSLYPLNVPQEPSELRHNSAKQNPHGVRLSDWYGPPVAAAYVVIGYAAERDGRLFLRAWLISTRAGEPANAVVFGKVYVAELTDSGAQRIAHDFAADILRQFGATTLADTKIYFVSDRTGRKEIWAMDHDGGNQKQVTNLRSITLTPAVSADGTKVAFTTYAKGNPKVGILSLISRRPIAFRDHKASLSTTPEFTTDGKGILVASSLNGSCCEIYMADHDGGNVRLVAASDSVDVSPKVNPRTGDIVFVSDRSGTPQIYRMNSEGADVQRLTDGSGYAANPAWHPEGAHIAFAWTRGYAPGSFNIFVMDAATRKYDQLTHGAGRNEHPSWAPDGRRLVFDSDRSGKAQIWTMRADGTRLRQLTTVGENTMPVWGKSPE